MSEVSELTFASRLILFRRGCKPLDTRNFVFVEIQSKNILNQARFFELKMIKAQFPFTIFALTPTNACKSSRSRLSKQQKYESLHISHQFTFNHTSWVKLNANLWSTNNY